MFKKFWQAIIVGVLEIVLIILAYYLLHIGMKLSINYVYVIMVVTLIAYTWYLITVLDAYEKYMKKKKEKKTNVNVLIKTKPLIVKKEVKPHVIKKIIDIPSGDLSFIELKDYIKYNLYYGRDPKRIKHNLLEVGWTEKEIDRAFDEVGEIKPIMHIHPKQVESIKEEIRKEIMRLKHEVEMIKNKPRRVERVTSVVLPVEKKSKSYDHRFVGSKSGGKYHTYDCSWGKNIEKKKQRYYKSHVEAQKKGHEACRSCIDGKWVKPKKKKVIVEEVSKKEYLHRFVASKDGGKYHTYNCHWGDSIEKKKQRFFRTKVEAERKGYTACRSCMKK